MITYTTNSVQETNELAKKLAKDSSARIFLLTGKLGTGKTTFVQGVAKSLGIKGKIISPTFVLIRQYHIPNTNKFLYHVDLYRLEDETNIEQLGLKEIISDPNNIVLIEWAGKVKNFSPKDAIKINITKEKGQKRIITVS